MEKFLARWKSGGAPGMLTDAYILVMVLVFPLFTGFEGYANITLSKFLFFVISTLLWLGALVFVHLRFHRPWPRPHAAMWWMLAFLAWCCVSALLSPHRADTFWGAGRYDGLVSWLLYGGAFLGCCAYGRWRRVHTLGFGLAVTVCCALALLQLMGYDPLWLYPGELSFYDGHVRYTGQFLGTIGNTNLLSSVLCLAIPFFCGCFLCGRDRSRFSALVPMALGMFVLTASGVSGGMLALLLTAAAALPWLLTTKERLYRGFCLGAVLLGSAALALAFDGSAEGWRLVFERVPLLVLAAGLLLLALSFLLRSYSGPFPAPRTLRRLFLLLLLLAAAATLVLLWFWPGESGTAYELSQVLHGNIDESFGSSRIRIWKRTLELFAQRPLLGCGPGTLALELDIEFSRLVEDTGETLRTRADNAHNVYLQVLSETGLPGLAAYLGVLLSALRSWGQRHVVSLAQAMGLAVLCYALQGFFSLELCLNAPLFWIFLGLCVPDVIHSSDSED